MVSVRRVAQGRVRHQKSCWEPAQYRPPNPEGIEFLTDALRKIRRDAR